jgi:hypothetical protein
MVIIALNRLLQKQSLLVLGQYIGVYISLNMLIAVGADHHLKLGLVFVRAVQNSLYLTPVTNLYVVLIQTVTKVVLQSRPLLSPKHAP